MPIPATLRRLAALALLLLLPACGDSPAAPKATPDSPAPPKEGTSAAALWLQANAHPIRSLDVADRDFSDLQPLKAAIGSARVVLLGEQSHGDGTTFLAKARLIAFLHQEMGFDVLAWESGLWGVHRAWEHVQAGEAALPASRRGIFSIWTRSEQVLPTLDYVQETVGTAHPLELAGFDNQESGSLARDSLHLLMERFARRIGSPVPDDPEWAAAAATLQHLAQTGDFETKPFPMEQERLLRLLAALRADAAAKAETDPDARFWTQALASLASFAQMQWAMQPGKVNGQDDSVRDAQMARNLVWLANVGYPGKKIIVWAASSHIARDVLQLRTPAGQQLYAVWDVHMGGEAYRTLGTEMYAIGFTAGTGTAARIGLPAGELDPARPGSLEARFQEAGLVNAFVDFRSRPAGGDWLKDVYARPFGYLDLTGDWTRVLDGMVYTRDMTPSTKATR
ncbi:MAG: erythromycin esterase family protein [Longimicrobiaceae bacterium]